MVSHRIEGDAWKKLVLHCRQFSLVDGLVYYVPTDDILHRVARHHEIPAILASCHSGITGGHYARDVTIHKVWQSGLWWPTVTRDATSFTKTCDVYQRTGQPAPGARMPHRPVLPLEPFQKWGLDFMGPFNPPMAQTGNQYFLMATDYSTKWVEANHYGTTRPAIRRNSCTRTSGVGSAAP
mgnify:CR=1 FL=1